MPITAEAIRTMLEAAFPAAAVVVRDTTGGGDHFSAQVISDAFTGRTLIERHRMVYAALGPAMHGDIHALQLETNTPSERGNR
jgi:stress-induced morphogen